MGNIIRITFVCALMFAFLAPGLGYGAMAACVVGVFIVATIMSNFDFHS